jgi:hypothetical protein
MDTIRASEIGLYMYCRRAWWYNRQGLVSENQEEMAGGTAFHREHGRKVVTAGLLRLAGWIALLLALVVVAVTLTLQLVH